MRHLVGIEIYQTHRRFQFVLRVFDMLLRREDRGFTLMRAGLFSVDLFEDGVRPEEVFSERVDPSAHGLESSLSLRRKGELELAGWRPIRWILWGLWLLPHNVTASAVLYVSRASNPPLSLVSWGKKDLPGFRRRAAVVWKEYVMTSI